MSAVDKDVEPLVPTLAELPREARTICLAYWESGYVEGHDKGWSRGYAAAYAELAERWGVRHFETDDDQRAYANRLAKSVDYPTYLDRLGEHDKAERFRTAYQLLGILPGVVEEVA